jgi:hypothetical protein
VTARSAANSGEFRVGLGHFAGLFSSDFIFTYIPIIILHLGGWATRYRGPIVLLYGSLNSGPQIYIFLHLFGLNEFQQD